VPRAFRDNRKLARIDWNGLRAGFGYDLQDALAIDDVDEFIAIGMPFPCALSR
jgi:hypothetical protein